LIIIALNPKPYRWTANPQPVLEKIYRAWEAMLKEANNPIYGRHIRIVPIDFFLDTIYMDEIMLGVDVGTTAAKAALKAAKKRGVRFGRPPS
jgi:hypothetical protein